MNRIKIQFYNFACIKVVKLFMYITLIFTYFIKLLCMDPKGKSFEYKSLYFEILQYNFSFRLKIHSLKMKI